MTRRDRAAVVLIAAVWLISTALWITPGVTRPDGAGYFSYLPSLYLDHDLLLFNQWQQFGLIKGGRIYYKEVSATDHLANHWTAGSSLFWTPAFVAGDALRGAVARTKFPRNGLSLPYNVPVVAASSVAALAALLLAFAVSRRVANETAAAAATIAVWFGSPLLFYALKGSLMSHAVVAMSTAVIVWLSLRLRDELSMRVLMLVGMAAGFAFSVRPQTLPFALLPFIVVSASRAIEIFRRTHLLAGGFVIGAAPQFVVSQFFYGNPLGFLRVGGNDPGRPWRPFERIWPWEPIFSWYHGLATWTPLLLLAVIGFAFLWRKDRALASAAMTMFALQWVINSTMERSFWGAFAFGQRRFESCTIFFVLGLASWIELTRRRVALLAAMTACCAWTMLLFFAATSTLDLNRYYTPHELTARAFAALSGGALTSWAAIPSFARSSVLLFAIIGVLATVLLVVGCGVLARSRAWGAIPATFIVITALIALCGSHDAAKLPQYAQLIAYNRALGARSGGSDTRETLLQFEYDYLMQSGRVEAARRTAQDIEELRALRGTR